MVFGSPLPCFFITVKHGPQQFLWEGEQGNLDTLAGKYPAIQKKRFFWFFSRGRAAQASWHPSRCRPARFSRQPASRLPAGDSPSAGSAALYPRRPPPERAESAGAAAAGGFPPPAPAAFPQTAASETGPGARPSSSRPGGKKNYGGAAPSHTRRGLRGPSALPAYPGAARSPLPGGTMAKGAPHASRGRPPSSFSASAPGPPRSASPAAPSSPRGAPAPPPLPPPPGSQLPSSRRCRRRLRTCRRARPAGRRRGLRGAAGWRRRAGTDGRTDGHACEGGGGGSSGRSFPDSWRLRRRLLLLGSPLEAERPPALPPYWQTHTQRAAPGTRLEPAWETRRARPGRGSASSSSFSLSPGPFRWRPGARSRWRWRPAGRPRGRGGKAAGWGRRARCCPWRSCVSAGRSGSRNPPRTRVTGTAASAPSATAPRPSSAWCATWGRAPPHGGSPASGGVFGRPPAAPGCEGEREGGCDRNRVPGGGGGRAVGRLPAAPRCEGGRAGGRPWQESGHVYRDQHTPHPPLLGPGLPGQRDPSPSVCVRKQK